MALSSVDTAVPPAPLEPLARHEILAFLRAHFRYRARGPDAYDCLGLVLRAFSLRGVWLQDPFDPGHSLDDLTASFDCLGHAPCPSFAVAPWDVLYQDGNGNDLSVRGKHVALVVNDRSAIEADGVHGKIFSRPLYAALADGPRIYRLRREWWPKHS